MPLPCYLVLTYITTNVLSTLPYWSHLGTLHHNEKFETAICEQLQMKEAYLYRKGILKFLPTWHTCIFCPDIVTKNDMSVAWISYTNVVITCHLNLRTVCTIYRTSITLPSRCSIVYIFFTTISTEYFKHNAHSPFFSSECHFSKCKLFVHVLFTFDIQGVLKFKFKV
jgi:hypothetical protein